MESVGRRADLGASAPSSTANAATSEPPMVTSGLRIGTPAMTTRGFGSEESALVGQLIAEVLDKPGDEAHLRRVRDRVNQLTARFPVYG